MQPLLPPPLPQDWAQGPREGSEVYSFAWARPCHLGLQRKGELSWVWLGRGLASRFKVLL